MESLLRVDSFFAPRRFALILAILVGACFVPVLLGFQSFVFRDFGVFGHPLASYYRDCFWRGEVPLWNPLNNCGLPFMAQWNTMVFYPGSLIYLLLPLPWSLNLFCLLHLYFGGLGIFFLARRWSGSNFAAAFAGLVFTFNGLALHCLMWPNNVAALGWMPWILMLVERAWSRGGWSLLPAVLAGTCQFMAGAPEAFLFTWIVTAFVWLAHAITHRGDIVRSFLRFTTIVLGVVAMSAVQLLPLLELIQHSQRSEAFDTGSWAMSPWGWANLLVPLFRTIPSISGVPFQIGQAWTSSYYFGVVTLLLALVAVVRLRNARVWTLVALVIIGLVLALGDSGYAWPWLKTHVGALGFMRFPVKLVFLVVMPLTLLAALGAAELLRKPPVAQTITSSSKSAAPISARVIGLLTVAMVCGIAFILWVAWRHPSEEQNTTATLWNGAMRALFLLVLAGGLEWMRRTDGRRLALVSCAWLGIVLADFLTHVPWQNPTISAPMLEPRLTELQPLREQAPWSHYRLMPSLAAGRYLHQSPVTTVANSYLARRMGQSHNLNLLEGLAKPDGFFSLYLAAQQEVQFKLYLDELSIREPIADAMAITFMTAPGKLFEWSARTNPLAIVSAGQAPVFLAAAETLRAMAEEKFDPRSTVFLPTSAQGKVKALRTAGASVAVEGVHSHEMNFKVTTPSPAMVTISHSAYPAWKAYVDGVPVSLWRANHAFQAVEVPAGEHRVRLRYEDKMFRIGAMISGGLLLLVLVALVLSPRCRRFFSSRSHDAPVDV